MPRRREVPKREVLPGPALPVPARDEVHQLRHGARQEVHGRGDLLRRDEADRAEDVRTTRSRPSRRPSRTSSRSSRSSPAASAARPTRFPVEVKPNRRTSLAIRWLIIVLAGPRREDDARQARRRAPRRRQQPRKRREEEGGHPQDGRGQQGLRPLPLVSLHEISGRRETGRPRGSGQVPSEIPDHASQRAEPEELKPGHASDACGSRRAARRTARPERFDGADAPGSGRNSICRELIPSKCAETSASWPTSTPVRRRRRSGSSITRGSTTRSARSTTGPRRWTGWSRSRSAASRSRRPRRPASGRGSGSTSSTRRATSTSRPRWSARSASSTAPSPCSTPSPASSRSPRPSGARPTATGSPASRSSTRWTASAPTSRSAST